MAQKRTVKIQTTKSKGSSKLKVVKSPAKKRVSKPVKSTPPLIFEVAWEVCNQVGGIYTVIRSKTPAMVNLYADNFILVGPYLSNDIEAELDRSQEKNDAIGKAVASLNKRGLIVHDAIWLITGRPRVLLIDITSVDKELEEIKYNLWSSLKVENKKGNPLIDQSIAFGYIVKELLTKIGNTKSTPPVIAHFHEWQASVPLLYKKKEKLPFKTIFTTHATILGRYLAYHSPHFYNHLPFFDIEKESNHFGIYTESLIERYSAKFADKMTTVSDITANESTFLLKKKADAILPNGLNIKRFDASHEFQNLHATYKDQINRFVMGYFFQSYPFDLDKTLYFFTSGRYEYRNKGFDITLEALEALNEKLKKDNTDITIVTFIVTRKDHHGIKSDVLESRALMEEIRKNCNAIHEQVGQRLFYASTTREDNRLPDLSEFVDDYWRLRYRRTIQTWKTSKKPSTVTHNLDDPINDEILNYLSNSSLDNGPDQKVKIVYHPEFINTTNPLFGLEYGDFVRGCHLGIFPSYYEPWGYTPLECMARGVPSITSDLSGFGDYISKNMPNHEDNGLFLVNRHGKTYKNAVGQLVKIMAKFIDQNRRERIMQRNKAENASVSFDWQNLIKYYDKVYHSLVKF